VNPPPEYARANVAARLVVADWAIIAVVFPNPLPTAVPRAEEPIAVLVFPDQATRGSSFPPAHVIGAASR